MLATAGICTRQYLPGHSGYCWRDVRLRRRITRQKGVERTENAKCRNRRASNGAEHCLAYALKDYQEMETCYEREYLLRNRQWAKLSEAEHFKAADLYKIMAPDMLIN